MQHHCQDLRDYLQALQAAGELQPIDVEVDWQLELGGIIRRSYDLGAPAPLFNHIKGINSGMRVFGAPAGLSAKPQQALARAAISLGLPTTSSAHDIVKTLASVSDVKPVKPTLVKSAVCKENSFTGTDVDLLSLPCPQINLHDGGRYLNTWGTIVCETPDGSWVNWGIARIMLLNATQMVANVVAVRDTRKIYNLWREEGKAMPFAVFQGGAPAIPFISGLPLPRGVNEVDMIGGYLGQAIELVKCETVPLAVPANSEIVIEGFYSQDETALEGPMADFTGYVKRSSDNVCPVMNVTALTYRNNAILPVVSGGYPIEENHSCWALGLAARVYALLRKHDFPVAQCFVPYESAVHWLVISIEGEYWRDKRDRAEAAKTELLQTLKALLFQHAPSNWMGKVFVVNDDIDTSDIKDVVWAFATRCHPHNHIILDEVDVPIAMGVYYSAEEKAAKKVSKVVYDCLLPPNQDPEQAQIPAKFVNNWPETMRERICDSWHKYGY